MQTKEHGSEAVDTDLHSRDLPVFGFDAMLKMQRAHVLIVGARGVGVEIAKNLILTGVRSVQIHDSGVVSIRDLGSQFYLTPEDVGKNRAEVCLPRLKELNASVNVSVLAGQITEEVLKQFHVIVVTHGVPLSIMKKWNQFARTQQPPIKFIVAEVHGLFAAVFDDFGPGFEVNDPTGEEPLTAVVTSILKEGQVFLDEDGPQHNLMSDALIKFDGVRGFAINSTKETNKVFKLKKVLGTHSFQIDDLSAFGEAYQGGGLVTSVTLPVTLNFKSFEEALINPDFTLFPDFAKFDSPPQLHLYFQSLHQYFEKHGRFPQDVAESTVKEFLGYAAEINAQSLKLQIDEKLFLKLLGSASAEINPMCAFVGGVAAQEALKAVSSKFHPINQWLLLDAVECIPDSPPEDFLPLGTRYDDQILCIGRAAHERLTRSNVFLVGAGALGCEFLKNFSLMGVSTAPKAQLFLTDMDTIEKSNLSRQFLFRNKDIGKLKAEAGTKAAQQMNPDIKINALSLRVGKETENVFHDAFWDQLDVVVNALDNFQARAYVDDRCKLYGKPLLESGTLATKAHVQVILPGKTETYGDSSDPPEKTFQKCTLTSFPNRIEHTLQWARDHFEGVFKLLPESAQKYIEKGDTFLQDLRATSPDPIAEIGSLKENLVYQLPKTFFDCILWARLQFEDLFSSRIRSLIHAFPPDAKDTKTGGPFWSGPKRPPTPLKFDPSDATHMNFIIAAAYLRAHSFGIKPLENPQDHGPFLAALKDAVVPEWQPTGIKIKTEDGEQQKVEVDDNTFSSLIKELPDPTSLKFLTATPISFEKDDDTNFHMQFITAASNLRARCYSIQEIDFFRSKVIAGNITPAIATTTAMICGLVCLELYKIALGNIPLDRFKNAFVNLALPQFVLAEPGPPVKYPIDEKKEFNSWDFIHFQGDLTLQEVLDGVNKYIGNPSYLVLGLNTISGNALLFPPSKKKERLPLKMSEVMTKINQPLDEHSRYVILDVACEDEEGNGVTLPKVKIAVKH